MIEEPQASPPDEPAGPPIPAPEPKPPPIPRFRTRRPKTPPPPTINELAVTGDVEAVLTRLRKVYVDEVFPRPFDSLWDCMRTALEAKRLSSLDDLAETLLGIIISTNALLLIRAQITTEALIAESDRSNRNRFGDMPGGVVRDWVPRVAALQADLKTSIKALGTFRHTRALADKNGGQEPASEQ